MTAYKHRPGDVRRKGEKEFVVKNVYFDRYLVNAGINADEPVPLDSALSFCEDFQLAYETTNDKICDRANPEDYEDFELIERDEDVEFSHYECLDCDLRAIDEETAVGHMIETTTNSVGDYIGDPHQVQIIFNGGEKYE